MYVSHHYRHIRWIGYYTSDMFIDPWGAASDGSYGRVGGGGVEALVSAAQLSSGQKHLSSLARAVLAPCCDAGSNSDRPMSMAACY